MSQPLSLRLPEATVERLNARARRHRIAPRTLAQRYVEEGLRMDEHPLVRFVDGPAGRDAGLVGTRLRVWPVIDVVQDNGGDVAAAAAYLELPLGLIQAAVNYYGAYPEEIDKAIEGNRREREEAHAAWLAGQAALVPTTYRRTKADVGRLVTAQEATLAEYPGEQDLANGETWL